MILMRPLLLLLVLAASAHALPAEAGSLAGVDATAGATADAEAATSVDGPVAGTGVADGAVDGLPAVDELADTSLHAEAGTDGLTVATDGPVTTQVGADPAPAEAAEPASGHGDGPVTKHVTTGQAAAGAVGLAAIAAALLAKAPFLTGLRRALFALPLALAGFSRIKEDELLDQPVRRQIMDLMTTRPGSTISDVTQHVGVAWGTAVYHLQRLEKARLLVSEREGRDRRYWEIHAPEARLRKTTKVLRFDTPRRIAALVRERPGLIQKDIRDHLGLAPSIASRHVKRLSDAGLIETEVDGRTRRYRPTELLATAWDAEVGTPPAIELRPAAATAHVPAV